MRYPGTKSVAPSSRGIRRRIYGLWIPGKGSTVHGDSQKIYLPRPVTAVT
jgi:hypothetical protein